MTFNAKYDIWYNAVLLEKDAAWIVLDIVNICMCTVHNINNPKIYAMKTNSQLTIGTFSGTLLSILPNLLSQEILKTVILAAVGAAVSFVVSLLLKVCFRKHLK